jgi:hypothetical protein
LLLLPLLLLLVLLSLLPVLLSQLLLVTPHVHKGTLPA